MLRHLWRLMMEGRACARMQNRICLQMVKRPAKIVQQQLCEITADTVADQDALDDGGVAVRRQWIGGDQPAPLAYPFGQVVQREAMVPAVLQFVADRGSAPLPS